MSAQPSVLPRDDRTLPSLSSLLNGHSPTRPHPTPESPGYAHLGGPNLPLYRPTLSLATAPVRHAMLRPDPAPPNNHSSSWQTSRDLPSMTYPQHSHADPTPPLPLPQSPHHHYAPSYAHSSQAPLSTPAYHSHDAYPSTDPEPSSAYPDAPDHHSKRTSGRSTSDVSRDSHDAFASKSGKASSDWHIENIPGEGECYVFPSGRVMKTTIGGEKVNPTWGITKAGKPRKRLAQACVTCRLKKIKCEQGDPQDPKCGQCSRLNRVCTRPQDSQPSPDSSEEGEAPAGDGAHYAYHLYGAVQHAPSPARKRPNAELSGEAAWQSPPGAPPPHPAQTTDNGVIAHATATHPALEYARTAPKRRKSREGVRRAGGSDAIDTSRFRPDVDPASINPDLTVQLIQAWMRYRSSGPQQLLPRDKYCHWAKHCNDKSLDDIAAVYANMALGSALTLDPAVKAASPALASIAEEAEAQRSPEFTLQLCMVRGCLTLYHYAKGNRVQQQDYLAKSATIVKTLGYHTEDGVSRLPENAEAFEYGMTREQAIECRRRTFWSVYCFDRYTSFTYGSMGFINDLEVFLRLPCTNVSFESGTPEETPHFHGDSIRGEFTHEPGALALLVDAASMWGDVTSNAYRARNRSRVVYKDFYNRHWDDITRRLDHWESSLPLKMRYSPANTVKAVRNGYFGDYLVLHATYAITGTMLGRIGRHSLLDRSMIKRNVKFTLTIARKLLNIIREMFDETNSNYNDDVDFAISQPFVGFSILNACDVLSSGGIKEDLSRFINGELESAKKIVKHVARFWCQGDLHRQALEKRQADISARVMGMRLGDRARLSEAMETRLVPPDHDMIYSISEDLFYEARSEWERPNDAVMGG